MQNKKKSIKVSDTLFTGETFLAKVRQIAILTDGSANLKVRVTPFVFLLVAVTLRGGRVKGVRVHLTSLNRVGPEPEGAFPLGGRL